MAKIAIGGWQHETNTFATIKADYHAFVRADEWPPLAEGLEMLNAIHGVHLPINGAISALESQHELVPLLWCSATPSAHVTEHAFESISERFLTLIKTAMPLDAIYLDLHGAMVCEHLEDGEGELLRRIRGLVGEDIPIFVSLDLHANVTPMMVECATLMDIFRTYPHIDMGQTGFRTGTLLDRHLQRGEPLYHSYGQIDFLIALNRGCSLIEPCKTLYEELSQLVNEEAISLSFACGFHLSDIYNVGPSVISYSYSQESADEAARQMISLVNRARETFYEKIWPCEEGVRQGVMRFKEKGRTVILADTQDNPGGGGSGDTTGLLQSLIHQKVEGAIFGAISDPSVVEHAQMVGVGGEFDTDLGGKSGLLGQAPYHCRVTVLKLADGNFTATGPMYKGANMSLGPCALLNIEGVKVMVCSKAVQTADQEVFRHVGIEPRDMDIIALKSSVHFRNDFEDFASEILIVSAPGAVFADPAVFKLQKHSAPV